MFLLYVVLDVAQILGVAGLVFLRLAPELISVSGQTLTAVIVVLLFSLIVDGETKSNHWLSIAQGIIFAFFYFDMTYGWIKDPKALFWIWVIFGGLSLISNIVQLSLRGRSSN